MIAKAVSANMYDSQAVSAKGAKYDSQGQVPTCRDVAPGCGKTKPVEA